LIALTRPALCLIASAAMAAFAFAHAHAAETYPSRPIRIIIAVPHGSGPDILARQIGSKLTEKWGQQIVIDSRPGATGLVGAEIVAKAAPDGYTLWFATLTQLIGTTLYQKYVLAQDFAPVGMVASTAFAIAAHSALPVSNIPELIAYAKARPGKLLFASTGQGSTGHLCMESFQSITAIEMVHVPYKGATPANADLMAGQVQITCQAVPSLLNFVKTGRIRLLGVTTLKPTVIAPDVPTIAETVPGFELLGWYGLLAPKGTPRDIVMRINNAVMQALKTADVQEKLITLGAEAAGSTPEEFARSLQQQTQRWSKVLVDAGINAAP
jgi:tripartite-type tricarboxylate transporter receptor subunit TctC